MQEGHSVKKKSIQKLIDNTNPDIIAITETWFKSWIPQFDEYHWIHKMRTKKREVVLAF